MSFKQSVILTFKHSVIILVFIIAKYRVLYKSHSNMVLSISA